jgi:histidyl-tRNA synthetase
MSQPQQITAPTGTADVLPADSAKWQAIERIARETAALFHFKEIRTPTFEHSELFHRGVGEATDMVQKETYTFTDRGGRSITLKPDQTAPVVRAILENGLLNDPGSVLKVFYLPAVFRYERPQKGRLREHHQFGVEVFGVAAPEQDVECMLLAMEFYKRCGVKDLALRINSLGDRESKLRYRDVLVKFLEPGRANLSEDSQRRLETNPLRILDSKDPRDIEACRAAPPAIDSLSEKSRAHFARAQEILKSAGVDFCVDGSLVRGFDYYTDVLWEATAGGLGAQNAIGGGGRYDNLVEQLGGKPTPGVGFGIGLERLLLALNSQGVQIPPDDKPLVWLISHGDAARGANLVLMQQLRAAGIAADTDLTGRNVKSQFKLADRERATWCIVVGDAELTSETVMLKNMATQEQASVPRAEVVSRLQAA